MKIDEGVKRTLILGEEKLKLVEDLSFLSEISEYFQSRHEGFLENQEHITIGEVNGTHMKYLLEELRVAKDKGINLQAKLDKIITPDLYTVCEFLKMKLNMEMSALLRTKPSNIVKFVAYAKVSGNQELLEKLYEKVAGMLMLMTEQPKLMQEISTKAFRDIIATPALDFDLEIQKLYSLMSWMNISPLRLFSFPEFSKALNIGKVRKNLTDMLKEEFTRIWTFAVRDVERLQRPQIGPIVDVNKMTGKESAVKALKTMNLMISAVVKKPDGTSVSALFFYHPSTNMCKETVFLAEPQHATEFMFVDVFGYYIYSFCRNKDEVDVGGGQRKTKFTIERRSVFGHDEWKIVKWFKTSMKSAVSADDEKGGKGADGAPAEDEEQEAETEQDGPTAKRRNATYWDLPKTVLRSGSTFILIYPEGFITFETQTGAIKKFRRKFLGEEGEVWAVQNHHLFNASNRQGLIVVKVCNVSNGRSVMERMRREDESDPIVPPPENQNQRKGDTNNKTQFTFLTPVENHLAFSSRQQKEVFIMQRSLKLETMKEYLTLKKKVCNFKVNIMAQFKHDNIAWTLTENYKLYSWDMERMTCLTSTATNMKEKLEEKVRKMYQLDSGNCLDIVVNEIKPVNHIWMKHVA